ncbi:MAG: PASTA domain-containing protein [Actinomycetota bacterium]|nr:PASTA domain-containing protein [Actinomycetota bacterium]
MAEAETVVEERPPATVVEEEVLEPLPPPPPGPLVWPWLLVLLILVVGGLLALWLLTRDDGKSAAAAAVVPNVIGQPQSEAVARVNRRGLIARVVTKPSEVPAGRVFAEEPGAGSRLARKSVVTLSVSAADLVAVPNVVGQRAPAATAELRARGLAVETSSVASNKPRGTVLSQSPAAGAKVAKGSTVVIRISRGMVSVPDVVGQTRDTAVAAIRVAGLVPRAFTVPSTRPKGTVVAQSPKAGTRVPGGSKVRLNISNGQASGGVPPPPPPPPPPAGGTKPATVTAPDVTGQPQEDAQRQLNSAGLKAGLVYVPSDQPEGTVVSQSPDAGTTQKRGTRIQLNVSLGPSPGEQRAVPDVLGKDPAAAKTELESAGFKAQTLPQGVSDANQVGTVVDEQPAGGRRAPVGSTVTIYVGRPA